MVDFAPSPLLSVDEKRTLLASASAAFPSAASLPGAAAESAMGRVVRGWPGCFPPTNFVAAGPR